MSTNQDSKDEMRQLNVRVSLPIYEALVLEAAKRTVEAGREVTKQEILLDSYGLVTAARLARGRLGMGSGPLGLSELIGPLGMLGRPIWGLIDGKQVRMAYDPSNQAYVPEDEEMDDDE